MPWCEPCGRFYTPSTLSSGGDCPAGHHVMDPSSAEHLTQSDAPARGAHAADDVEQVKIPWHFWVLVIALGIYLGWRLVQGIAWLLRL